MEKPKLNKVFIRWDVDENPDMSYLEYDDCFTDEENRLNAEELQRFCDGEKWHEGCRAVAKVTCCGLIQTFLSAGLWGIDSESDTAERATIENEELDDLKKILQHYNIDTTHYEGLTVRD